MIVSLAVQLLRRANRDTDSQRDLSAPQCAMGQATEFRPENSSVRQIREETDTTWRDLRQLRDESSRDFKTGAESLAERQSQASADSK